MWVTSFENQDIMTNMIFPTNTTTRFFKALVFTVYNVDFHEVFQQSIVGLWTPFSLFYIFRMIAQIELIQANTYIAWEMIGYPRMKNISIWVYNAGWKCSEYIINERTTVFA